jgi:hypothetical protein
MVLIVSALLIPASNVSASDTPPSSDVLATYQFLPDPDYTQDDEKAILLIEQYNFPLIKLTWLDPQGEAISCGSFCITHIEYDSYTTEFYIAGRGLPSGTYTAHVLYCSWYISPNCLTWTFWFDGFFRISDAGFPISGNAGVAGASLSYFDGTAKTAFADDSGNYTINVPPGWSGTVTPSKPSYIFLPPSMTYSNVQGAYSEQNYTAMEIHNTFLPLMVR